MITAGFLSRDGKSAVLDISVSVMQAKGIKSVLVRTGEFLERHSEVLPEYVRALEKSGNGLLLMDITAQVLSVHLLDHLSFDILVHCPDPDNETQGADQFLQDASRLYARLRANDTAVVNSDDFHALHALEGVLTQVVTYGFNPRATLTASSVEDMPDITGTGGTVCCLQRSLRQIGGSVVEPQEFQLKLSKIEKSTYTPNVLAASAFLLVCGILP